MVRMICTITVFATISVAGALIFGAARQFQNAGGINNNPGLSIIEKFNAVGVQDEKISEKIVSPLVEQARNFALYLNPPKPEMPKIREVLAPEKRTLNAVSQKVTAAESTKLKPKFTLIGISYYRPNPDKSMALVSEPGKGIYWIKKDSHIEHFTVDHIKRGKIVYRDGNSLREMVVDLKVPAGIQQAPKILLASNEMKRIQLKLPISDIPQNTGPRRRVYRLGAQR